MSVDDVIARARALIGTQFRLHGRSQKSGVDCVGLVALAYDQVEGVPYGYALRGDRIGEWAAMLDALLHRADTTDLVLADVILMRPSPAQLHLGLWTGTSLIHADTRLRRVVETPGPIHWPLLGVWRDHKEGLLSWPR